MKMQLLKSLPENAARRLTKVIVRTIHLVGIAGVFGGAMTQTSMFGYLAVAIVSGTVLTFMEASSGVIWFVQLRGVSLYIKLLLLWLMHLYPDLSITCLIAVIVISGFMSHAPSWIRYFSVLHGRVVHADKEMLG
jgi:hypothetical protein